MSRDVEGQLQDRFADLVFEALIPTERRFDDSLHTA